MAMTKKNAGSTQRAEMISVRVHPKTKYCLDLLARVQRRTLSSVVERSIEKTLLQDSEIGDIFHDELWDTEEADRFIKLALNRHNLLTYEEELLWKHIKETPYFWEITSETTPSGFVETYETIIPEKLRKHWDELRPLITGKDTDFSIVKTFGNEEE